MADYLLGWRTVDGASEPDHEWHLVRPLADGEGDALRAASTLLGEVVGENAFADLLHAVDELEAAHRALVLAHRAGVGPTKSKSLDRRYKAWLGTFRSYVDRTHHSLSATYGRESDEYERGDKYFSEQFDTNFAYRLACALRNVSEHQSSVLNAVKMRSRLMNGRPIAEVDARIDLQRVARSDTKGRLRPATRREMEAVDTPVDAGLLVEYTMLSCHLIQAMIVLDREEELRAAIALVRGLHGEGVAAGGDQAVTMNEQALRGPGTGQSVVNFNPHLWAEVADALLAEAQVVRSQPRRVVTASDLA